MRYRQNNKQQPKLEAYLKTKTTNNHPQSIEAFDTNNHKQEETEV